LHSKALWLNYNSRRTFAQQILGLFASACLYSQTKAARIVSTAPSITEALFALGLGDQVVGVSRYCNFPPQVAKLPKVGSYLQPDLESVARLTPALVVLQNGPPELTDRLKLLGIPYILVPHGTLEDVFAGITLIAQAAGVPERSSPLIARIQEELRNIKTKARTMPSPSVVVIIDRKQGTLTNLTAIGPGNYFNQLLEIAGGINILAKPSLPRYPHISLETIVRENPDVILDLSGTRDTEAERQASSPAVLALWAQNTSLKAVHSGRIYFGTSDVLVVPGPRAPLAAQMLFDYMHKDEAHG
jgi:iron complex transport system substrate-binding protein